MPGKAMRKQLEKVAGDARRLLASINLLSPPARSAAKAAAGEVALGLVGHDPEVSDALRAAGTAIALKQAAVWVNALEQCAAHAASEIASTKQDKPGQTRARGIVIELAREIRRLTGQLPPGRDSWFADFTHALGEVLGLEPRVLRAPPVDIVE